MRLSIHGVRVLAASGVLAAVMAVPAVAGAETSYISSASGSGEVSPTTTSLPAATTTTTTPPNVLGEVVTTTTAATATTVKPQVLGESVSANGLAVTGADVAGLAAIGAVSIVAGGVILSARRRRSAEA